MPLEKKPIERPRRELVCPECDSYKVTPLDNPDLPKPKTVIAEGPSGEWEYTNICWDCGWKETVTVTVLHKPATQKEDRSESE